LGDINQATCASHMLAVRPGRGASCRVRRRRWGMGYCHQTWGFLLLCASVWAGLTGVRGVWVGVFRVRGMWLLGSALGLAAVGACAWSCAQDSFPFRLPLSHFFCSFCIWLWDTVVVGLSAACLHGHVQWCLPIRFCP